MVNNHCLVVWNHGMFWLSIHLGNVIIPTDELHHFSEGFKPPTSYKYGGVFFGKIRCKWWFCSTASHVWLAEGMSKIEGLVGVPNAPHASVQRQWTLKAMFKYWNGMILLLGEFEDDKTAIWLWQDQAEYHLVPENQRPKFWVPKISPGGLWHLFQDASYISSL